ncbi:LysR family transcriptional regulator [Pseudomonas sp. No.21]|jgi:DNA-binding transcriptional LysR family regulator|uniref:LysR family transcriptional regulator n=1 Tax=Pseudomonas tohonis TaxID=2725477 RepID=UPI001F18B251|nr:LysR family transcriptional regulator [Pseudomonas tohonis]GJN45839.1 transcriptional regulator [Pseudomonas tohonis]
MAFQENERASAHDAAGTSGHAPEDGFFGLDVEAAHYFVVAARCGCFMQAARSLSIKPTLLRKKLGLLAAWAGHPLFQHQGNALVLSPEGRRLRTQLVARLAVLSPGLAQNEDQPLVRIAVAEPLLHDILGRDLLAFLRQHANVRLELARLDEGEAPAADTDLRVWLAPPDDDAPWPGFASAHRECLAQLEYLPHVAKRYSRETSRPRSLVELADYMLVDLQGYAGIEALRPWNLAIAERRAGVTRVNSYEMLRQMIQWSACIGLLPHYVGQLDKNLMALPALFEPRMDMQAWLAVRAGEEEREEVRRLVALVHAAFDERRDWF